MSEEGRDLVSLLHEVFPGEHPTRSEGPTIEQGDPLSLIDTARAKVVRKPWGEERWLVHEDSRFMLKFIYIKEGFRTSLQFHHRKDEALFVLTGRATLVYGLGFSVLTAPPRARRDPPQPGRDPTDLPSIEVGPGDLVHIPASVIHRVEAVEDVLFLEASTPDLDDIVRLEDDWSRGQGRIEAEHD